MEENEARNLVFINVKNVEYLQPTKEWISVCTWWRMRNDSYSFLLETKTRLKVSGICGDPNNRTVLEVREY